MLSMQEFMELVDYKITEIDKYFCNCYGVDAYQLTSWNGIHGKGGYSFSIVFDTKTQAVYEVEICDYTNDRAYRIIAENMQEKHRDEASHKSELANQAWDGVDFVDLEMDEDFMEKALAVKSGLEYDTRVSISIEFTDQELLQYMKLAHNRNVTFNELVEETLSWFIEEVNSGRISKESLPRSI